MCISGLRDQVYQVKQKDSGKIFAMKMIKKNSLTKAKLVQHTIAEQRVLSSLSE